ncbi:MAG: 6-phosphogluconolactonase, partial [Clostridia bacterium]|nr:6-phosphogluconolactonase [Clostridia bacterium]
PLVGPTHKTGLTESTIEANSRFFASADEVPKHALTMGMAPIMKARKIIMLVSGKGKHAVLREMLSGVITTKNPATLLNLHDDVTVVCDEEAYNG